MPSDIRSIAGLLSFIYKIKKGTALTIPYSGEPERPRRSNYPAMVALSAKKHLLASVRVQSSYLCLLILYTFFRKNPLVILKKFLSESSVGSKHTTLNSECQLK